MPTFDEVNELTTSGALPPRSAAMILSSLMPPTTLTSTAAFLRSYLAATFLNSLSSRALQPTHTVSLVAAFAGWAQWTPSLRDAPGSRRAEHERGEQDDCRRYAFHLTSPGRREETTGDLLVKFTDATLHLAAFEVKVPPEFPFCSAASKVHFHDGPQRRNPAALKDLNERTVLDAIRSGAPISRAEISRRAGISKPTVSLALQSLLDAGLVRETQPDRGGRPTAPPSSRSCPRRGSCSASTWARASSAARSATCAARSARARTSSSTAPTPRAPSTRSPAFASRSRRRAGCPPTGSTAWSSACPASSTPTPAG